MHEQMPRNTGAIIRRRRDKPVHENLMVVDGPDVHGQNSNLKYIPLLLLSLPSTWLLPDATLKWLWTPAQILAMRAPQVKLDYIILVAAFHGNLVPYSSTSCISRTHSAYSQCKSRASRTVYQTATWTFYPANLDLNSDHMKELTLTSVHRHG